MKSRPIALPLLCLASLGCPSEPRTLRVEMDREFAVIDLFRLEYWGESMRSRLPRSRPVGMPSVGLISSLACI